MKRLFAFLLFAVYSFAQVYTVNITAAGSGYTSVPSITASGGACTTQPTFLATTNANALSTVTVLSAGLGCTSAPALAIGGPGTAAAATAVLLPSSAAVLSAVTSRTGNGITPDNGGTYTSWIFVCVLEVPAARVPFYAVHLFVMPGTSQTSAFQNGLPVNYPAALTSGIITEFQDSITIPGTAAATLATAEAQIVTTCAAQQTALNAWNAWSFYGTRFLNGSWTVVNIP
jgi:hypothetical protein